MDRGDTLRQTIARKGPLTVERAAALGRRIAEAIAELHAAESAAGSSLDPDTVRIWFDENGVPTAVLTPGAKGAGAEGAGARPADDVPRLGALLYELLAGFPPPRLGPPPPVERARPEVPERLAQLVMQCFEPDPGADGGPRSAADIAQRLAPFETDASSYLPTDPRLEPGEWTQRIVPEGSFTKRIDPALLLPLAEAEAEAAASAKAESILPAERSSAPAESSPAGRVLAGPLAPERAASPAAPASPASPAPSRPDDSADADEEESWERPLERTQPIEIPPEFRAPRPTEVPRRPATVYRKAAASPAPPERVSAGIPETAPPPASPARPMEERARPLEDRVRPLEDRVRPLEDRVRPLEDRTFARDLTGESGVGAIAVGADPEETIVLAPPPPPPPPPSAPPPLATESKPAPRPAAVWGFAVLIAAGVAAALWIGIHAVVTKRPAETVSARVATGAAEAPGRSASAPAPALVPSASPATASAPSPLPSAVPVAGPSGTLGASAPAIPTPVPAVSPSPSSGRAQDEERIRETLDAWIESANARDLSGHMRFYMPRVATFYLSRDVSSDVVWNEKARQFAGRFEMHASRPEIQFESDNRATVRFRKTFVVGDRAGAERRGEVLQEMQWVRTARGWRIAAERDR